MYTVGTAYGANVQGDKTICLRTVFIVWESINKLKKNSMKMSSGTFVLATVFSLMFDFHLNFICNKSKA